MTDEEKMKLAKNNAGISTAEIKQDILDTEREIADMTPKVEAYRTLGDRMSHFRADGLVSGIERRKKFVEDLTAILEIRKEL